MTFIKVNRKQVRELLKESRNFVMLPIHVSPVIADLDTNYRVDAAREIRGCNRVRDVDDVIDHIIEERNGRRGLVAHWNFFFRHPSRVGATELSMAIDCAKERDGWTDRPDGPLCVPHASALDATVLRSCWDDLFAALPGWIARAPISLVESGSRKVFDGIGRIVSGGSLKDAHRCYRQSDVLAAFAFLNLPHYVYTRPLHERYEPREYRRARKAATEGSESAVNGRSETPALGGGSEGRCRGDAAVCGAGDS